MNRYGLGAVFAAALVGNVLGGCSSGPKYKVNDQSIASVSTSDKGGILAAQQEINIANEEQGKSASDAKAARNELDIVENEDKSQKLKVDSAKLSKQAADQSGDVNRKAGAIKEVRMAQLGLKLADAKVQWVRAKKKYYDELQDAAAAHARAAIAKVELEKARLAAQKGIKPSDDFNLANFETQNMERQRKWDEQRARAEQKRIDVERVASTYNLIQQEWNQENNISSQQPSQPYDPNQQQPTPTYAPQPQNQNPPPQQQQQPPPSQQPY